MKVALTLLVVCIVATAAWAQDISDECMQRPTCMLTDNKCKKPLPSLTQCYKYNQEACCVAGHDEVIKSAYEALWAPTCVREYANLELLFCLGCNLDQGRFVDTNTKTVRVCQSFANALFDGSTTAGRNVYDNCGVLVGGDQVLLPGVATVSASDSTSLIQNSTAFLNLKINGAYPFRPPFFKDFNFEVVPDNDADGCFSSDAAAAALSAAVLVILAVVSVLLL